MIKFLHVLGWLAILAIAVLSLMPGDLRPHVGSSHYLEHFAAYLVTAILITLGPSKGAHLIMIAMVLMVSAGILEMSQLWVPSRNSSVVDFAASSLGVWCGVFVIFLARKWVPLV